MKSFKRREIIIERFAYGMVNAILLAALGVGIFRLFDGAAMPLPEPQVLAAQSVCDGVKLNYPRIYTETINGKKISFKYNCIRSGFIASSYDGNCEGCSGRTHFTNEPVVWGICAVDQHVIAPHSFFYVPGYGPCKAADKGGAVRSKKIDLGFEDVRLGWWSRRVTDIYTLVK